MASVFGHSLAAYTIAKVANRKSGRLLIVLAILSSILPDIDVIAFQLQIPYGHPLGHRGFTHSILFAVIWSVLIAILLGKNKKILFAIILFFSTISHGILDAFTTGGKGVGFFIPFNNARHFFPNRIIKVSPITINEFFSQWGKNVILSELKYIGVPCLIILVTLFAIRKIKT